MYQQWQKYLAEFFGTLVLVFGGTLTIVGVGGAADSGIIAIAFGFGLALLIGLYAFGEVSGGHYNPAVTLAMLFDRRISFADLVGYWISQVVGAVIASVLVLVMIDQDAVAETITTHPLGAGTGIVSEIAFTAVFVGVILAVTKSTNFGSTALLAIPLALVGVHLAAIPFSGASVNPARSLGPALVGAESGGLWLYLTMPFVGAFLAWVIYRVVNLGDTSLTDDFAAVKDEVT